MWQYGQWIERGEVLQKMHMRYQPGFFSSTVTEVVNIYAPVSGLYHMADALKGDGKVLLPEGVDIPADVNEATYGDLIRFLDKTRKVIRKRARQDTQDISDQEVSNRLNALRNYSGWYWIYLRPYHGDDLVNRQPELTSQLQSLMKETDYYMNPEHSKSASKEVQKLHKECALRVEQLWKEGWSHDVFDELSNREGVERLNIAKKAIDALDAATKGGSQKREDKKEESREKQHNQGENRQRQKEEKARAHQESPNSEQPQSRYQEALAILELEDNAGFWVLKERYKWMCSRLHPDKGGSNYMQERVNWAYNYLLEFEKWTRANAPPQEKRTTGARSSHASSESGSVEPVNVQRIVYPPEVDVLREKWELPDQYTRSQLEDKHFKLLGRVPNNTVDQVNAEFEMLEPYVVED